MIHQDQKPLKALKIKDVIAKTGISRPQIYILERKGMFPPRLKVGARSVRYLESDIDNWLLASKQSPTPAN
jgi:prophage regulatory protein